MRQIRAFRYPHKFIGTENRQALQTCELPLGVDLSVFDMGVNAGIWRSAKLLQQVLGFTGEEVDGSIASETLAAANRCDFFGPCV